MPARRESEVNGSNNSAEKAASYLRPLLRGSPRLLVVAGSGLGGLADGVVGGIDIPFHEIPGYPATGVRGHAGSYLAGSFAGVPALIQRGRYHLYEGHPRVTVSLPIRVAARLGVEWVILTNAAGGIHPDLAPGTMVLLRECLDFQGVSPLPPRVFPFDPAFLHRARPAAVDAGITLPEGRYAGVLGPSFETPAEIRMLAAFGADVVGMSTIVETAAAIEEGLSVIGLSLVTNRAAGTGGGELTHEEVLQAGSEGSRKMVRLIQRIVEGLSLS